MLSQLPIQKPKVFDFRNSQTVAPSFSFARASQGSYLSASGLTKYAGISTPRLTHDEDGYNFLVEPSSTNILLNSDNINTFNEHEGMTYTSYPDGWFAFKNDSVLPSSAVQYLSPSPLSKYSFSAVFKYFDSPWVSLSFHINHNTPTYDLLESIAWFNLETGELGDVRVFGIESIRLPVEYFSSNIQDLGNGEYKCSLHCNTISALDYDLTGVVMYSFVSGDSTGRKPNASVYYKNPQTENASTASSYIPTGDTPMSRAADITSYDLSGSKAIFVKGVVEDSFTEASLLTFSIGTLVISFIVSNKTLGLYASTGTSITMTPPEYNIGVCVLRNGDVLYGINGQVNRISKADVGTSTEITGLDILSQSPQLLSSVKAYSGRLSEVEFSTVLKY